MAFFSLANSFVNGTLPSAWGNWSNILIFNLANNSLTGALPALAQQTSMPAQLLPQEMSRACCDLWCHHQPGLTLDTDSSIIC